MLIKSGHLAGEVKGEYTEEEEEVEEKVVGEAEVIASSARALLFRNSQLSGVQTHYPFPSQRIGKDIHSSFVSGFESETIFKQNPAASSIHVVFFFQPIACYDRSVSVSVQWSWPPAAGNGKSGTL